MGTRCLTVFIDEEGKEICTLYRQYDGYLTGHGADLARILAGKRLVNGFNSGDEGKVFNGMGDLAAAVIALLKIDGADTVRAYNEKTGWYDIPNPNKGGARLGGFYLCPPGTRGDDWEYFIRPGKKRADGGNEISVGVKRHGMPRPTYSSVARFVAKVAKSRAMEEKARAVKAGPD